MRSTHYPGKTITLFVGLWGWFGKVDFRSLIEHSVSPCPFYTPLGENRETWLLRLTYSLAPFHPLGRPKVTPRWGSQLLGKLGAEVGAAPSGLF